MSLDDAVAVVVEAVALPVGGAGVVPRALEGTVVERRVDVVAIAGLRCLERTVAVRVDARIHQTVTVGVEAGAEAVPVVIEPVVVTVAAVTTVGAGSARVGLAAHIGEAEARVVHADLVRGAQVVVAVAAHGGRVVAHALVGVAHEALLAVRVALAEPGDGLALVRAVAALALEALVVRAALDGGLAVPVEQVADLAAGAVRVREALHAVPLGVRFHATRVADALVDVAVAVLVPAVAADLEQRADPVAVVVAADGAGVGLPIHRVALAAGDVAGRQVVGPVAARVV